MFGRRRWAHPADHLGGILLAPTAFLLRVHRFVRFRLAQQAPCLVAVVVSFVAALFVVVVAAVKAVLAGRAVGRQLAERDRSWNSAIGAQLGVIVAHSSGAACSSRFRARPGPRAANGDKVFRYRTQRPRIAHIRSFIHSLDGSLRA